MYEQRSCGKFVGAWGKQLFPNGERTHYRDMPRCEVSEIESGRKAPLLAKECRVPRHDLQSVPTHPLHFLILRWAGEPVLDHGRALALQLDFADQSAAVIKLQPVAYTHPLHPLSRQGVTDGPVFSPQRHLASRIHLQHARARPIFPARWIGLIASW